MNIAKKICISILLMIVFSLLLSFTFAGSKIIIGYYEDYPLVFKNDDGNPDGFAIDLANKIFEEENIEIKYVYGTWKEMLIWLENGKIDLVLDISKNERRDEIYDFNEKPLLMSWGKVCVNSKYNVNSILDLDGLKIGYMDNDYYAAEKAGLINKTEEFNLNVEYYAYPSYEDVLKAIEKNEVNGGIINKLTINQIYNYKSIKDTPIIFAANGIRVATLKDENNEVLKKIDEYIAEWKSDKNSFYYEKYEFWFENISNNNLKVFYYENKKKIVFGIVIIVLIIVYSRMELYFKTKELKKVNMHFKETNEEVETNRNKLEKAYKDVDVLVNKFEKITDFLSENMEILRDSSEEFFLSELLKEAMDLVKEADYGIVYNFNENEELIVIETINIKRPDLRGIRKSELIKINKSVLIIKDLETKLIIQLKNNDNIDEIAKQVDISKESLLLIFEKNHKVFGGILLEIKKDSKKSFAEDSKRIMIALKNIAESYFINESYHEADEVFQKEIIFSMVKMLEIHDEYAKGHSETVSDYSKQLAKYIGMSNEKVNEIYYAGLVHDIGKILISKDIINKAGKLTIEEYEEIKMHPIFGYKSLNKSKVTKDIAKYVLYHHERIDGDGYPEGLKGEEIPIESRIIAIADSFDAMTAERNYKKNISKEDALKEIMINLNTQFDNDLGLKFIEMMER
jgi:HD-GYP domain-containing protein (c-di-GMP phosphodiesterase class II)/ABC-type amino acid transport substrate-binding protein